MRRVLLLLALALLPLAACEHPIAIVTPHVEAADLLVADSTGALLTRTELNRSWTVQPLVLRDGEALRVILTPLDFRGEPIDIGERRDLSFRMEAEDGALLQWEPQRGFGWIRPFAVGETRVRFLIWHVNHADFVSPWLRVVVHPPGTPLAAALPRGRSTDDTFRTSPPRAARRRSAPAPGLRPRPHGPRTGRPRRAGDDPRGRRW